MPKSVVLDQIDVIRSQQSKSVTVDDVYEKLKDVDLSDNQSLPVAKLDSSTLADGQVLTYDNTSGKWVNNNAPASSSSSSTTAVSHDLGIDKQGVSTDTVISYTFGEPVTDTFDVTGVQDGEALVWDATNGKWTNGTVSSGSTGAISHDMGIVQIEDSNGDKSYKFGSAQNNTFDITSVQDGDTLSWDATNGKWVNSVASSGSTGAISHDMGINKVEDSANSILTYNFGATENSTFDVTGIQDGEHLTWDATNGKWVNSTVNGGGGGISPAFEMEIYDSNTNQWKAAPDSGASLGIEMQTFTGYVEYVLNENPVDGDLSGIDVSVSDSEVIYEFKSASVPDIRAVDTDNLDDGSVMIWNKGAGQWEMSGLVIENY